VFPSVIHRGGGAFEQVGFWSCGEDVVGQDPQLVSEHQVVNVRYRASRALLGLGSQVGELLHQDLNHLRPGVGGKRGLRSGNTAGGGRGGRPPAWLVPVVDPGQQALDGGGEIGHPATIPGTAGGLDKPHRCAPRTGTVVATPRKWNGNGDRRRQQARHRRKQAQHRQHHKHGTAETSAAPPAPQARHRRNKRSTASTTSAAPPGTGSAPPGTGGKGDCPPCAGTRGGQSVRSGTTPGPRGDGPGVVSDDGRTVSRRLGSSSAGAASRCRARRGRPGCRTPRSTSSAPADPSARPPRSR
jgi:hypothetical protein